MNDVLAAVFTTALNVSGAQRFLLMFPLCLSIALVYKTTRCERLREVPMATLALWATIVLGMSAVGVGFWVLYLLMT